jgi:hypothetical protein
MAVPEGFRIASAYVEVHLEDNTEADEKRIRARLEKGGPIKIRTILDDPEGVEKAKEKIRKSEPARLPVKAEDPIDEAWRAKVKSSLKATANDALKIPITPESQEFQRRLSLLIRKIETGLHADIPVDLDKAAEFKREVEFLAKMASEETKVRIPVEVDEESVASSAEQAKGRLQAILFTALAVGLPAAAAVGAAGVAASITTLPAVFTALAAFALKSNADVRQAFSTLKSSVVDDTKAMAQTMSGPLQDAAGDLQASFERMRPQIQAAFAGSAGLVDDLTGSVTDLAEGALPGMVTAIVTGGDALKGFRSFTGQVGQGLSDMFTNMSKGSTDAGQSMQILGGITRDLLGFVGTLTANLSSAQGPLSSLQGGLLQAESAILKLTTSGGAATHFLSGFTNTASGALTAVNGFASVLNVIPQGITQFGGSLLAAGLIASKFGISATAAFAGLGGRIREASGAGAKLTTAMGGLVAGALNPATLAVVGLGVLLGELGRRQAEAAAKAQDHARSVQNLTSALQADGGIIGNATSATVAKALADKNAAGNAAALGVSLGTVQAAALGNGAAMNELHNRADALYDSFVAQGKIGKNNEWMFKSFTKALAENGGAASDAAYDYGDLNKAQQDQLVAALNVLGAAGGEAKALRETQEAARALKSALSGVSVEQLKLNEFSTLGQATAANLAAAFDELAQAGGDVQAKGQALIAVFDAMHGSQMSAEEAMQAWNDQMRSAGDLLKDLDLGARNKDFMDAAGAINTASEAGSKFQDFVQGAATHMAAYAQSLKDQGLSTDQITQKLQPMEAQLRKQLQAWGLNDKQITEILKHYGAIPEEITTTLKISGGEASKIQVQTLLEEILKVPADKGVHVTTLTEDAKHNLEDLGYKIVELPDGTFQVFANTQPGADAATLLMEKINHYMGIVSISANDSSAQGKLTSWQQRADGTVGMTTTDTKIEPGTNKVLAWQMQANGTWGWSHLDSRIEAGTNKLQVWVQRADGTWGWVNADARTGSANAALDYAARPRTAVITGVYIPPSTTGRGASTFGLAKGGLSGYASGGQTKSLPGYASGSLVDATRGGLLSGPGTPTSDDILTIFSNGLGKTSDEEFVIKAKQTKKWLPLLVAINEGLGGFADGGPVKYGSVTQTAWDSLLAQGWRGDPKDGMEALYPPSGKIQAEDGSWVDPSFYSRTAVSRNPQSHDDAVRIKNAGGDLVTSYLPDGYKIGTWVMSDKVNPQADPVTAKAPVTFKTKSKATAVASSTAATATERTLTRAGASRRGAVTVTQYITTSDPMQAAHAASSELAWALRDRS